MRIDLLGCPVDALTMAETLERIRDSMRDRRRLQHVALNVAKFIHMRSDPVLKADVMTSDIVGIDGMGIVLAARILGLPAKDRVAGIDLFREVLALCAEDGFRPFLLGATPRVLDRARAAITSEFPNIQLAGLRDGYFRPDQEMEVVREITNSKADCLFIAMPTPRKERFLAAHRDHLGIPFTMGIGGSLDVISGHVRRAPRLMQSVGLEWLYRVYQEPRRMWWRYAKTNTLFATVMFQALIQRSSSALHHALFRSTSSSRRN